MNNKKNIKLYSIVLLFVFIMSASFIYYYFCKNIKNSDKKVVINKVNLLVNQDTIIEFNLNDNIKTYNFSIKNNDKILSTKYKIKLNIIDSYSNIINENFVYTLIPIQNFSVDNLINKSETPVPIVSKEIGSAEISSNNLHEYKLIIKLKNNSLLDNPFKAKITILNDITG